MDLVGLAVQEENLAAQEFLAVLDHLDLVDHLEQEANPERLDLREHLVSHIHTISIDFKPSKYNASVSAPGGGVSVAQEYNQAK